MMIDVSRYAGFPLAFDPHTLELSAGNGLVYERVTRKGKELKEVLYTPEAVADDADMYYIYYVRQVPDPLKAVFNRDGLTYGPVLLPPLKVGPEFVKTAGHYHPDIPSSTISYPEIYTQLYGTLLLFLQKRSRVRYGAPEDCALVTMTPGVSVTVPPDYAHVLINPTGDYALMAGLYSLAFKADYAEVRAQRGLAYYVLDGGNGQIMVEPNSRYVSAPPLTRLQSLSGTIFAPPEPEKTVWDAYISAPEKYAWLHRADAATQMFASAE